MQANVGDRLISGTGSSSVGLIVAVLGDHGQPPYVVRWLRGGHIAMVTPGPYARIIPAGHPAGTCLPRSGGTAEDSGGQAGDDQPGG